MGKRRPRPSKVGTGKRQPRPSKGGTGKVEPPLKTQVRVAASLRHKNQVDGLKSDGVLKQVRHRFVYQCNDFHIPSSNV